MKTEIMKTVYIQETAYFVDDDKTTINVNVEEHFSVAGYDGQAPERVSKYLRTVSVGPNPIFEEFVKQVPLTVVEENTTKFHERLTSEHNALRNEITAEVMQDIGKQITKQGEAAAPASTNLTELTQDDLFKLKLQAFEIDEVKSSKNRELKAKIRKAGNLMEIVAMTAATILDNPAKQTEETPPETA